MALLWFEEHGVADEQRAVLYDAQDAPLAAWRTRSESCTLAPIILGDAYAWFGAQSTDVNGAGSSAYIVGTHAELATAPTVAKLATPSQGWRGTDTMFAVNGLSGKTVTIYDRLTEKAGTFGGGSGFGITQFYAKNDAVVAAFDMGSGVREAQIWTHATPQLVTLIHPANEVVPEINSDGTTLVWIQVPPAAAPGGAYPQGNLWTSPFASTPAALQPTLRRTAPIIGTIGVRSAANEGYYAFAGAQGEVIHVYRLSDMQHWSFLPEFAASVYQVVYVDAHEVWYTTIGGAFRQSIDALGPGDPP
jgi:hypothetical protein